MRRCLVVGGVILAVMTGRYWLPCVVVYAPSNSMPKGWYVRAFLQRAVQVGDIVVLDAPSSVQAALPPELPRARLLKQIAGVPGEPVCWMAEGMWVWHPANAVTYLRHPAIHVPPHPSECHVLRTEELLVVGQHPRSLDSRYIGTVDARLVQFRVWPLWTWRGK